MKTRFNSIANVQRYQMTPRKIYFDLSRTSGVVVCSVKTITIYFSIEHDAEMNVPPPTLIPTPYGGRLVWQLPGGNCLVAHLKDKVLIRHRKRWSQVRLLFWNAVHTPQAATTHLPSLTSLLQLVGGGFSSPVRVLGKGWTSHSPPALFFFF